MGEAERGLPCKGVISVWRRDRGHGQINDTISGKQYLAALAGNAGASLEPGVDLAGRGVRYCVQSTHLPVKWILDEYAESEAAELTAAAEPVLHARQIAAIECDSCKATVPPLIECSTQDQDRSVTLEQAGTNSLPVSVGLSATAGADQEQRARVTNQYNLEPEETEELISLGASGFSVGNSIDQTSV